MKMSFKICAFFAILGCLLELSQGMYISAKCDGVKSFIQDKSPLKTFENYLICRKDNQLGRESDDEYEEKLAKRIDEEFKKFGHDQTKLDELRSMYERWLVTYADDVIFNADEKANYLLDTQYKTRTSLSNWQRPTRTCEILFQSRAMNHMKQNLINLYEQFDVYGEEQLNQLNQLDNYNKNPLFRIYKTILEDARKTWQKNQLPQAQKLVANALSLLSKSDILSQLADNKNALEIVAAIYHETNRAIYAKVDCDITVLEQINNILGCIEKSVDGGIMARALKPIGEWLDRCISQTFDFYDLNGDKKTIGKLMKTTGIFTSGVHDNNVGTSLIKVIKESKLGESNDFLLAYPADERSKIEQTLIRSLEIGEFKDMCKQLDSTSGYIRRRFIILLRILLLPNTKTNNLFSSQINEFKKAIRKHEGLYHSVFVCNVLEQAKVVKNNGETLIQLLPGYENFATVWPTNLF